MTFPRACLMIVLVALVGARSCPPNPLRRSTAWLHQEWSRQHSTAIDHDSAFITPLYRTFLTAMNLLKATGLEIHRELDQHCPAQLSTEPDLEGRSLCPWYYIFNVDDDRYPKYLTEARCRCNNCVGNSAAQCETVDYNLLVLRKNTTRCDGDYYTYDVGYQPIAVGCTCAVPASG